MYMNYFNKNCQLFSGRHSFILYPLSFILFLFPWILVIPCWLLDIQLDVECSVLNIECCTIFVPLEGESPDLFRDKGVFIVDSIIKT